MKVHHVCSRLLQLHLSMCVCVFPVCPGVTSVGMRHLSRLPNLKNLQLAGAQGNIIYEQGGQKGPERWFVNLLASLTLLTIYGELWWHLFNCYCFQNKGQGTGRKAAVNTHNSALTFGGPPDCCALRDSLRIQSVTHGGIY